MTSGSKEASGKLRLTSARPYPGLAAFQEQDSEFFKGRTTVIDELVGMIEQQVLVLLYAVSGIGKSSLLNAGVFPRMREADRFPVSIRLDFTGTEGGATFIINQVREAAARDEVDLHVIPVRACGNTIASAEIKELTLSTLWGFFRHTAFFSRRNNRLLVPILVFDQFEELFTRSTGNPALGLDVVTDLADALEQIVPERLRDLVKNGVLDGSHHSVPLKCVISLREDFLPDLDMLTRQLPLLASRRYRLKPLSIAEAIDAVHTPVPGLISRQVAERVVTVLAGQLQTQQRKNGDAVEPALLSLFCAQLNEKRIAGEASFIDADLVQETGNQIIHDFYTQATRPIGRRTTRFIERNLVSALGFRTSAPLSNAKNAGAEKSELEGLVDRRLLRVEDRFGEPHYELIHDILVPEVREAQRLRHRRGILRASLSAVGALTVGVAMLAYLVVLPQVKRSGEVGQVVLRFREATEQSKSRVKDRQRVKLGEIQRCRALLADVEDYEATSQFTNAELETCERDAKQLADSLLGLASDKGKQFDDEQRLMLRAEADRVRGVRPNSEIGSRIDPRLALTLRTAGQKVTSTALGSDGRIYGLAGDGARVWNGRTGALLDTLTLPTFDTQKELSSVGEYSPMRIVVRSNNGSDFVLALFGKGDIDPAKENRESLLVQWSYPRSESQRPQISRIRTLIQDIAFAKDGIVAVSERGLILLPNNDAQQFRFGQANSAFLRLATRSDGRIAAAGIVRTTGPRGRLKGRFSPGIALLKDSSRDFEWLSLAPPPEHHHAAGGIGVNTDEIPTVSSLTWRDQTLIAGLSDARAYEVKDGQWTLLRSMPQYGRIEVLDYCNPKEPLLAIAGSHTRISVPFRYGSVPTGEYDGYGALYEGILAPECDRAITAWHDGTLRVISAPVEFEAENADLLVVELRRRLGFDLVVDGLSRVDRD